MAHLHWCPAAPMHVYMQIGWQDCGWTDRPMYSLNKWALLRLFGTSFGVPLYDPLHVDAFIGHLDWCPVAPMHVDM